MLLPKRRLQPRTFRLGEGQSIMLGALARVDVLRCPGATLYLTAWLSDQIPCHLGKTDAAEERCALLQALPWGPVLMPWCPVLLPRGPVLLP